MTGRAKLRLALKALHDVASLGIGGGVAACLVIEAASRARTAAQVVVAHETIAAIARYVLLPSLAFVLVTGLLAMMATRGYQDAGWAWVKAVLGVVVFQATLHLVGASRDIAALAGGGDPDELAALLRSERGTLWLVVVLVIVNVVLAVFRPRLTWRVR